MGNNEPAVDQSDLRIRGSYGLNVCIQSKIQYLHIANAVSHYNYK